MNQSLMPYRGNRALLSAFCLLLWAILVGCGQETGSRETATNVKMRSPPGIGESQPEAASTADPLEPIPAEKAVELTSCDGENTVTVAEDLSGEALAHALMEQWKRDHPGIDWVADEKQAHAFTPPADNSALLQGEHGTGHAYGNYSERDVLTWAREAEKFVAEGSRIFHSADELGSTVAVSCDMCHPHAANTHPETYPKFQVQLGRVALLRDMIDWCVENPVRGGHMAPDGNKMRALEAYIMAQRKGVAMDYGKH